jgi:fibronectin-binding autotransporter adhesin
MFTRLARPASAVLMVWLLSAIPICAQFTWSGAGGNQNWTTAANWTGGVVPGGNADVIFGPTTQPWVTLDTPPTLNSVTVNGSAYIQGPVAAPQTLTLGAGGITLSAGTLALYDAVPVVLSAPQAWNLVTGSSLFVLGSISGSLNNPVAITGSYGTLALAGNNSFYGTVTLSNYASLQLGSDTALGNATVTVDGAVGISSYSGADRTIPNAFTLTNAPQLNLFTSNGALKFTGPITLAGSPTLFLENGTPVYVSGTVTEAGGARVLTTNGNGTLVLDGVVSTTGGIRVNEGVVIFGAASTPPAAGQFSVYGNGYLGTAFGTGAQTFINRLATASTGTVGFDTATLSSPLAVSGAIDLSAYTSGLKLGSATSARIAGTITPAGTTYRFGGGGGTLEIASNLTGGNAVSVASPTYANQAANIIFSGTNTYTGGTTLTDSLLRFSSAAALPASGTFVIGGRSYLGFDYSGAVLSSFLARVNATAADKFVIGYDTTGTPLSISLSTDLMASLPVNAYLGTSTAADLLIYAGTAPANNLRLAAVRDGHLTVTSLPTGTYSVTVGVPNDSYSVLPSADYQYVSSRRGVFADSKSTVTLAAANTYSGGTTLAGGTLELGNATALGTGPLTVSGSATMITSTNGFTITNPIQFGQPYSIFIVGGPYTSTLSGAISDNGTGSSNYLYKKGPSTLHLAGASPSFTGTFEVVEGALALDNDAALTAANLSVDLGASASFTTTAPQVATLTGQGTVNLGTGTLTLNGGPYENSGYFYGTLNGSGGLAVTGGYMVMSGSGTYTGGTTVTGTVTQSGTLTVSGSTAIGTGPVTVSGGQLSLTTGTILGNTLSFTGGTLGGSGTFATPGGITVGTGRILDPNSIDYAASNTSDIGTLSFSTGLTLASGGTYNWGINNATGTAGVNWDTLQITGTLVLTATPASPFTLAMFSGADGAVPGFDNTGSYTWVIATASGGVTGLNPNAIVFDATSLYTPLGDGHFFLSQSGNDLVLNFSPVPEPSTWALLGLGVAGLLVAQIRRRR